MRPYALPTSKEEIEAQLAEIEKMRCERSLLEFFKRAWREVDPAPLKVNWHHKAICAHLEAVVRGEIRRLIINVPPRHTKSQLVSVMLPAWCWIQQQTSPLSGPQVKFLCVSYGQTLSEDLARLARRLVQSKWYQDHWGDRVKLDSDVARVDNFGTRAGGVRIASSITGATLGRGGDCVVGNSIVQTPSGPKCIDEIDISSAPEYVLSYGAPETTDRDAQLPYLRRAVSEADQSTPGNLLLKGMPECGTFPGREEQRQWPTYRRVLAVRRRQAQSIWRIRTRSGNVVEATGEHRFFTGRGLVCAMALAVGDILLRAVPISERAPSWRNDEVGRSAEIGTVLQPDMLLTGDTLPLLPRVRQSASAEQATERCRPLQRGLPPPGLCTQRRDPGDRAGTQLRDLQQEIPSDDEQGTGEILFSKMQGHRPFKADEGSCQSGLPAWHGRKIRKSAGVDGNQEQGVGKGWLSLSGMRSVRRSGCSSSEWPAARSSSDKSCLFMSELSQNASRGSEVGAEEDIVAQIDEVPGDFAVYDIQVEGTECFFANGILVHNCRILDDALSVDQAESKIERENVNKMYSEALQTRETDPTHSCEIIIMQRLHEEDLTGYILSQDWDDVVQVIYPARHDPARHCTTDWYDDPRTEPGELLWPERFGEAEVARLERALGPYSFAGQFQQQPTPRGGGIFQREWIQPWPPIGPDGAILDGWILQRNGQRAIRYPSFEFICAAVDTAFTEKKQNDPCAMTVWGIFRVEGESRIDRVINADGSTGYVRIDEPEGVPRAMIMFGWQKHLKLNGERVERPVEVSDKEWNSPVWLPYRQKRWGLVEWVVDTCRRWKVQFLRIETQGQGHGLEDEMRRLHGENLPWVVELVPTKSDKVAMAHSVVPIWSGGQVFMPQYEDGSFPTWLTPIVDEICVFPRGKHDDAVDTTVAALRMMRERGMLEREEEIQADESALAQYSRYRPVRLPYMD